MDDLIIRKAEAQDVPRMADIEEECFPCDAWSFLTLYRDVTNNPQVSFIIAELEGEIAGYLGFMRILDEADIINVAVSPEHRGRHIAEAMLSTAIDMASKKEITSLTLEVRADNEPAIGLYEKFGFKKEGTRKSYYAYDGMDAVLMRLVI